PQSLQPLFGTGLRHLSLFGSTVDDEVFQHVGGLQELRRLRAGRLKITNRSMTYLALCDQLEELDLADNQIGDLGVWRLAGMRCLRRLDLARLPISDDSLRYLVGMQQLRRLELACCDIYEHGLAYLEALPLLEWLELGAY